MSMKPSLDLGPCQYLEIPPVSHHQWWLFQKSYPLAWGRIVVYIGHMKTNMHNNITSMTADWKVCFQGVMYRHDLFTKKKKKKKNAYGRWLARQALTWMCYRLRNVFANHNIMEMDIILCIYIATISPRTSKDPAAITWLILVIGLQDEREAGITHPISLKRK